MVPYLQDDIRIHPTAYIAPSARIYGKVSIGAYSSIWDGVVIRGDMAAIDIGEFSSIQENAVIHVDLDIPENLPQVLCRSQQIQQVLVNLLTNAHDALNEKFSEYDEDKIIRISAHPMTKDGMNWVRTTVEDHGSGISEEVMQSIFDPFFTTKPREKGTGLGLSVSFGIIREHQGELTVESTPGEHTRFHIDLQSI